MSEIQHRKSCHLRHKPIIRAPRGALAIVWIYVELIQKVIEDLVSNAVIVENAREEPPVSDELVQFDDITACVLRIQQRLHVVVVDQFALGLSQ